jgi:hypothetical protein
MMSRNVLHPTACVCRAYRDLLKRVGIRLASSEDDAHIIQATHLCQHTQSKKHLGYGISGRNEEGRDDKGKLHEKGCRMESLKEEHGNGHHQW